MSVLAVMVFKTSKPNVEVSEPQPLSVLLLAQGRRALRHREAQVLTTVATLVQLRFEVHLQK